MSANVHSAWPVPNVAHSPGIGRSVARLQLPSTLPSACCCARRKRASPWSSSSWLSSPVARRRWTSAAATSALAPSRAS